MYIWKHLEELSTRTINKELNDQLQIYAVKINEALKSLEDQLKGNNYISNYLHSDIKREEVSLILKSEDKYLLKFEYFTGIIEYEDFCEVNYSKSRSKQSWADLDSDDEDDVMNFKKVILSSHLN